MKKIYSLINEKMVLIGLMFFALFFWSHRLGVNDLIVLEYDEAMFARNSLATIIFNMKWYDQTPIYFVLLHFWKIFGEDVFALRSLNLFLHIANILVIYKLTKLIFGKTKIALAGSVLLIVSPLSIECVHEGRMYTLLALFIMATFYFYIKYFTKRRLLDLSYFTICALLSMYTHFFAILTIGPMVLFYFFWHIKQLYEKRNKETFDLARQLCRRFFIAAGLIGIFITPIFIRLYLYMHSPNLVTAPISPNNLIHFIGGLAYYYFVNSVWNIPWHLMVWQQSIYVLCIGILFTRGILKSPRWIKLFVIFWIGSVILIGYSVSLYLDFRPRYFSFLGPIILLMIAHGAWAEPSLKLKYGLSHSARAFVRRMIFVYIIISSLWLSMNRWYDDNPAWRELMTELDRRHAPGIEYYVETGPVRNSALMVIETNGYNEGLKNVYTMKDDNRKDFVDSTYKKHTIVIIDLYERKPREYRWRAQELLARGYTLEKLRFRQIEADIFTPPS